MSYQIAYTATVRSRPPIQTKRRVIFQANWPKRKIKDSMKYFHLVARTCPTNCSHVGTWNQFEFVGLVAGTKFWSLWLHFLTKMGSSHKGTWSPGLVAGTSPLVCAGLSVRFPVFIFYNFFFILASGLSFGVYSCSVLFSVTLTDFLLNHVTNFLLIFVTVLQFLKALMLPIC